MELEGKPMGQPRRNRSIVLSYRALRRLIGILGMSLPAVCALGGLAFGGLVLQRSISYYYHTNVRDFFVGLMVAVAFFLMTHKGHERIDIASSLASGVCGLGLALFPCLEAQGQTGRVGFFGLESGLSDSLHLGCAALFFILLALNSLFLFTRTHRGKAMGERKRQRNLLYRVCGIVILACLAVLLILMRSMGDGEMARLRLVFILETVMLEAFGLSWLVKGETLFRDQRAPAGERNPGGASSVGGALDRRSRPDS